VTPAWLRAPTTIDWAAPRRFTPSALFSARAKVGEAKPRDGLDPQRRGILLHRLLQELPGIPADLRNGEAMRFLARAAGDLPDEARARLAAESLAVLDRPDFAILFGPQSRGEVELFGRLFSSTGEDDRVRRIDRLVVTPDSILIADYKTDAHPPARPEEAPEGYLAQLALYRALLGQSLPGRAMRAFLVWTAGPAIQEVPQSLLDDVWRRVTSL
jgi:ATP-dependent helicase/nuclease subunit A